MKKLIAALLVVAPVLVAAQTAPVVTPKVTVTARGHDVRQVLGDVFGQAKKSYVLQPNIQFNLFLSLDDTEFDRALTIICQQAGLTYELKDGVYFVHKMVKVSAPAAIVVSAPKPVKAVVISEPAGKLPASVLDRKVTTRLSKTSLRTVLATLGDETAIKIEVDPTVPAYKVDAFLVNTSLRFALNRMTKAANLVYSFTDHQSILITLKPSSVTLVN